jgi:hypothetical protein
MSEQPDTDHALQAASDAIDRACAELDERDPERDPERAAGFRDQQEKLAQLRETYGMTGPEVVHVTWTQQPDTDRVTWVTADEYERLVSSLDADDRAYVQAIRARKRGSSDD